MYKNTKLHEVTKKLVAVAQGIEKAELVIKNVRLVNVNTRELQDSVDIAVASGRIAYIGNADHTIGKDTKVFDGKGQYALPGFIDGHIHVESSMMTVSNYAKAVIPRGTTAIFADPHEIANVLGTKGVDFMIEDSKNSPLRFFVCMPSCVPAVAAFEDSGAIIKPSDISNYMLKDEVCGLGEMMNFPGVLNGDNDMHEELQITLENNKTITGHYSIPENDRGLNAYIASGVRCCHETVRKEDAIAKMRLGMYVQIREGSAWKDLKEVVRSITETNIDPRFASAVSDDAHPHTLITEGHMDHVARRLVEEGVNPLTAVQMTTLNVAECYGMSRDLGSISPGKCADIVIVNDLPKMSVKSVFIAGEHVAQDGELIIDIKTPDTPEWALNSVKLPELKAQDFKITVPDSKEIDVDVRVIQIIEAKVGTYSTVSKMKVKDGEIKSNTDEDIIKIAVLNRHNSPKVLNLGKGFVKGFGLKGGAIASTVAHDAHNMLIAGDNDEDMAIAGNCLKECGGGMVVVGKGKVLAILPLPIGGIMSNLPASEIAIKVDALDKAWKDLGCDMVSPFMTMALISLAVLPELRLTNRGLIDTVSFKFTELVVK